MTDESTPKRAAELAEEAEERLAQFEPQPRPHEDQGEPKKKRKTHAEILAEEAEHIQNFQNAEGESFCTFEVHDHLETWPIKSKGTRNYLRRRFFQRTRKSPSKIALQQVLDLMESYAMFDAPERIEVFTRLGFANGNLYLDLCRDDRAFVEITPTGWDVFKPTLDNPSAIKFQLRPGMLPIPEPTHGGSLEPLRQFWNCQTQELFVMDLAWEVGSFHPTGPYPIGISYGEQGCAKSFRQEMKRTLIDPVRAPNRGNSASAQDLAIQAKNSRVVARDNLSYVTDDMSDNFCRLATGTGFAYRKLYTDDEEAIFDGARPILLNGIHVALSKPDLIDRSIISTIPQIAEEDRQTEESLREYWLEIWPSVLGALLDLVAVALRDYRTIQLERTPRMADFVKFVVAAENSPNCPWPKGTFLKLYLENRQDARDVSLESDLVAATVIELMNEKPPGDSVEGTATEILAMLERLIDERVQRSKSWPKAASALTGRLIRAAVPLRSRGIDVIITRSKKKRKITLLVINQAPDLPSPASPSSPLDPTVSMGGDSGDGGDDELPFSDKHTSNPGDPDDKGWSH